MTSPPLLVMVTLTIPRALHDRCGSPAQVKTYLIDLGVWPTRTVTERWRPHTEVPGYQVDLEVTIPAPMQEHHP